MKTKQIPLAYENQIVQQYYRNIARPHVSNVVKNPAAVNQRRGAR